MNIVYAFNLKHGQNVRHITVDGMGTLCGKYAARDRKPEGLPADCEECMTGYRQVMGVPAPAFRIEITRTWYYVESDESETWTTDPHRTEHSEIEYDSDAQDMYDTPTRWAMDVLRGSDYPALEANGYPLPDAIAAHWWLSGTQADNYTNEESEWSIRLVSPEWTPEMRSEVFRGAKWH